MFSEFARRIVRRGAVNPKLVVVLVIVVLLAGGYWIYQFSSSPKVELKQNAEARAFIIACENAKTCGYRETVTEHQLNALKTEMGMYFCPKCQKYTAYKERAVNPSVAPAGG
ncbi:MAG: hypothetical protein CHACPFDD_00429 [Phycisphaerae bacterium]|nr:hypothetical protein [Phycisphaerae bacterium]